MAFIRVTDTAHKVVIDLNVGHIVAFSPKVDNDLDGPGSVISLINGAVYEIDETPQALRSFIKKAEGTLPKPKSKTQVES